MRDDNMVEEGFVKLLEGLGEEPLKELLNIVSLIADPLGQELIKKASEPNSPIGIADLPFDKGLRDEALVRLNYLEKYGVFKSSFATVNRRTTRLYSITDFGRRTVS